MRLHNVSLEQSHLVAFELRCRDITKYHTLQGPIQGGNTHKVHKSSKSLPINHQLRSEIKTRPSRFVIFLSNDISARYELGSFTDDVFNYPHETRHLSRKIHVHSSLYGYKEAWPKFKLTNQNSLFNQRVQFHLSIK